MTKPFILVACCGPKLDHAAPARDLYTSDLFTKSRAYAERNGCGWAILSAKHGIVLPDEVIAPYDVTLKTMPAEQQSVQLINCAKCGVWVPQTKAVGRNGMFYCSNECSLAKVT